jgi:hypothetical protein
LALGYQLRQHRLESQTSMEELAELIQEPVDVIVLWESGHAVPTLVQCCQYLIACTVSVPYQKRLYALLDEVGQEFWIDAAYPEAALAGCVAAAERVTAWVTHSMPDFTFSGTPTHYLVAERMLQEHGDNNFRNDSWQLARLLRLPDGVTVQAIPHAVTHHAGLFGEFTIYDLVDGDSIVVVDEVHVRTFISDPGTVEAYRESARHMAVDLALSGDELRALIHKVIGA